MKKIVIAHGHSSIEILHSLTPLILSAYKKIEWKWKFLDYKISNLFNQEGDLLILVRKYHNINILPEDISKDFVKLKKNFSKIIYFDDSASPSMIDFDILSHVDSYWKRALFKNQNLYYQKMYGGRLFSDYYHKNFKVIDNKIYFNKIANNQTNFNKIKIAWNIGIGAYPLNNNKIFTNFYPTTRRVVSALSTISAFKLIYKFIKLSFYDVQENLVKSVDLKKKLLRISSRFTADSYSRSVGFQRQLALEKVENIDFFLNGTINKKEFINETYSVFGILSTFGWGEICYRDFEANLGGAYLIKPDMSHVDTWPNIYKEDMYFKLNWNLSSLDKIDFLFDNINECENAINTSRNEYLNCIKSTVPRCIKMINEVI